MDRLLSMQMFVRVVEKGSLTAAAEGSGMTATMVGNHIRELEKRLGARLLARTTRNQTLTEIGRPFYDQCVTILAQVRTAESLAQSMTLAPRGRLRVSAPINFGVQCLTPKLDLYLKDFPEVEIDLILNDRIVDIVSEEFDVAIRIGDLPDSRLIARSLAPWRRIVCAAPDYIKRRGEPLVVDDLKNHNCLSFTYMSGPERDWRFPRTDGAFDIVRVGGSVNINNGQALRAAALAGLGVIMQPEQLLYDDLQNGGLIQLLKDHPMPTSPMHVVYLSDKQMMPKLSSFLDFMVKMFRQ
jgi:DNA-binding transcriptional LysR family regulator